MESEHKKAPCYFCGPEERTAECHANCQDYKEYVEERNRINAERLKDKDTYSYYSERKAKIKKKMGDYKK